MNSQTLHHKSYDPERNNPAHPQP